jgi:hypothetical protein
MESCIGTSGRVAAGRQGRTLRGLDRRRSRPDEYPGNRRNPALFPDLSQDISAITYVILWLLSHQYLMSLVDHGERPLRLFRHPRRVVIIGRFLVNHLITMRI